MALLPPVRLASLLALSFLLLTGCASRPKPEEPIKVAPGVTFRRMNGAQGFQILEIDRAEAQVKPVVVAEKVQRIRNNFVGDAKIVRDWAEQHQALGGINAGFFGDTYDDIGLRKQIVQLAVVNGKVVAPGSDTPSTRTPGERYLRSAIGFLPDGTPEIAWAIGTIKGVIKRYDVPVNPPSGRAWPVLSAVACGPRLFANGERRIADRTERLVSPGKLVRAFVAYDLGADGRPRHLILGRASAAEFTDVADFLEDHYRRTYGTTVQEAMCLDGGASGQIVYRAPAGTLMDAEPTGVRVPTAILLLPK